MANDIPITNLADTREIIRARLRDHPPEAVEIVTLLVTELVANALEHGAGKPTLSLQIERTSLRGSVNDEDPTRDLSPLPNDARRERGRGLAIVDALATQWGVEPLRNGKSVWFSVDL